MLPFLPLKAKGSDGESEVRVHKLVLAAASEVFQAMLASGLEESKQVR